LINLKLIALLLLKMYPLLNILLRGAKVRNNYEFKESTESIMNYEFVLCAFFAPFAVKNENADFIN